MAQRSPVQPQMIRWPELSSYVYMTYAQTSQHDEGCIMRVFFRFLFALYLQYLKRAKLPKVFTMLKFCAVFDTFGS